MPSPATTNSKTLSISLAPHLSAAALTALLATPVELLTVAQFHQLKDALKRVPGGREGSNTIGGLLN